MSCSLICAPPACSTDRTGRPDGLAAIRRILVKTAAVVATAATVFADHGVDHRAQHRAVAPLVQHAHFLPGLLGLAGQFQADLVVDGQRPDRHADGLAHGVDLDRVRALAQQAHAFVQVGAEGAGGEKAHGVVDDDRASCGSGGCSQRPLPAFHPRSCSPQIISTRGILSTGEKKWMPMKFSGLAAGLGQLGDGQGGGIGTPHAILRQVALGRSGDLVLEFDILEHRLDNQVAALQVGIVGGGLDQAQHTGFSVPRSCGRGQPACPAVASE